MTARRRPAWLARLTGQDDSQRSTTVPGPPKASAVRPVDLDRVEDYLRGRDYRFVRDADGDVTGTWDDSRFWFMLLGDRHEILQVRGRWHRSLPRERRSPMLQTLNDWNRERVWPKVYLREEHEALALYCEVSADVAAGLSDSQLGQALACGLGTGVQFFASLDRQLATGRPEGAVEPGPLE